MNYFNDFSILVVLALFVMNLSGETYFFAALISVATFILLPIVIVKLAKGASQHRKTKQNVTKLRATGLQVGKLQAAAKRNDLAPNGLGLGGLKRAMTMSTLATGSPIRQVPPQQLEPAPLPGEV